MATPALKKQAQTITMYPGDPQSILILTQNPDGSALNVSSGYTLQKFGAQPVSTPNSDNGAVDLSGHVTPTFGATGVTLSFSSAQAAAVAAALQSLNNNYIVEISNDGGTTQSVLAAGLLVVNNAGGMI